jgi:hypothetical protein
MNSHRILGNMVFSHACRTASFLLATLCLGIIYFGTTAIVARSAQQSPSSVFLDAPAAIYATDPNDSWNKIFFYLFSRRVETRITDEFPELREATSFTHRENPSVGVSTRSFERDELGDRAIDALYPSFLRPTGAQLVLNDPVTQSCRKRSCGRSARTQLARPSRAP